MKILVVNTVRFRLNGITSVILNYYRNIDKSDLQIDFVVPNEIDNEYRNELEGNGSQIYQLPRKNRIFEYSIRLYFICRMNRYDIMHVHGNSSLMIQELIPALLANIPIRIAHSHNTTCTHLYLHNLLYPIFCKSYTHAFACGTEAGNWLFASRDFEELKNGIDLKKYNFNPNVREEYRRKIGVGKQVVIGHVGNFIKQKNHVFLLEIFAQLLKNDSNYLLLLISDGELMEITKQKAKSMGIFNHVLFLGKSSEVDKYLQAMDIFVLPSLYEGLPVVLVEAQAAGLPCIVSNQVSSEANLTDSLKFLSIQSSVEWVLAIQKVREYLKDDNYERIYRSKVWQERIKEKGYDIVQSASLLKKLYEDYMEVYKKKESNLGLKG